jgi:hypothetical protein
MKKIIFSAVTFCLLPTQITLAQNSPACQPPQDGEYLVFVANQSNTTELQRNLPPYTKLEVCQYLSNVVTRISGFKNLDDANSSADFLSKLKNLQAFVVAPQENTQVPVIVSNNSSNVNNSTNVNTIPVTKNPNNATKKPPANYLAFNPKKINANYAVLIDYFNQPELAIKIKQLLGNDIGLVSYGQKPYLIAFASDNIMQAGTILLQLNNNDFWAKIVDGRKVVLLRDVVSY